MKENSITTVFKILKWCTKTALVITGIIPLTKCSSGYKEKNGKVTFNGEEVTDKSFVVLSDVFAKNDSAAYYKKYSISGADVQTFSALDRHYAKDKAAVFYCDEEREGQNYYLTKHSVIIKVKDALPASFSVMGDGYTGYAKDSKRCYFQGEGFLVKDAASLAIIGGRFVKDNFQVYFEQAPVKGADAATFRLLNEFYAKDTAHVYYFGYHNDLYNGIHQIPCDVASFKTLDYPYASDAQSVFYVYNKINSADAATFSVIGNGFSKDKTHVYSGLKILSGADPATFALLPHDAASLDEYFYSKDKAHAFWKDKLFSVADIASFKALGLGYGTDGQQVYYQATIVKSADPSTFQPYDYSNTGEDAADAKHKYFEGIVVK